MTFSLSDAGIRLGRAFHADPINQPEQPESL
jgi:hypothetical protein